MKIVDPSGGYWRVGRRWLPWRRRLRGMSNSGIDVGGLGDDPISAVIGIVLLIVMLPFLVLSLVVAVEFAVLLLLMPFAILARIAFGQHWTVVVRRGLEPWWEASAGSWADSRAVIDAAAESIRRGDVPPRTIT